MHKILTYIKKTEIIPFKHGMSCKSSSDSDSLRFDKLFLNELRVRFLGGFSYSFSESSKSPCSLLL